MKIGHKLKNKRDTKKLSQQEVAEFLDVSQRTYSNFESNKPEPSLTQLSKLAEVLEFNLLDMLQEQGLVFNQTNNEFKDNSNGIVYNHNNFLDELKNQKTYYEARLKDKETIIKQKEEINNLLKDKINYLENK